MLGKNIRPMCGKPLIGWSITQAIDSEYVDMTMVSTDSQRIAEVSKSFGAEVPFMRPTEFATDVASSVDVVGHAIEFLESQNKCFDYVLLLQATSPIRRPGELDDMIRDLIDRADEFDSSVALVETPAYPEYMHIVEGRSARLREKADNLKARRQDLNPNYYPTGSAYFVKVPAFIRENSFYTQRLTYHLQKKYQQFDIDDVYDFLATEAILEHLIEAGVVHE